MINDSKPQVRASRLVAGVFAVAAAIVSLVGENTFVALLFFIASGLFFLDAFIQLTRSRKPPEGNDSL